MKIYLIYPLFLCLYIFYYYKNLNKQPLFTITTLLKNIRIKVTKSYDSDSIEYHLLKKFHWLLMYNSSKVIENEDECNKKLKSYINHPQLLEKILTISPVLKQAYELKKYYLIFNSISTLDDTKENLVHIIQLYINSDIDSYRQFASITLIKRVEEIINSRVKSILKVANRFKNFSRMKNKIMYCLNKDSLTTIMKTVHVIKQKEKTIFEKDCPNSH